MILTDRKGVPIEKPRRSDFGTDVEFMQAFYAYKDRIASEANSGFDQGLKQGSKRSSNTGIRRSSMAAKKRKRKKRGGKIPMEVLIKRYDDLGRLLKRRGFKE